MSKKEPLREKIASALSLPGEIIMNVPLVSVMGKNEVNVENYKNLLEFTEEQIRINTTTGILKIEGRKLYIKRITSENILISGAIGNIGLGS